MESDSTGRKLPYRRSMAKPSLQETKSINFLDLPLELRREIYHYCLPPKPIAFCVGNYFRRYNLRSAKPVGLLFVSKQVNEEALDILYGEPLFKYDLNMHKGANFREYFSDANIQRIRKLRILLDNDNDSDVVPTSPVDFHSLEKYTLDAGIDPSILARLTKLEIVAELPRRSGEYHSQWNFEDEQRKWLKWFEDLIKYIAGEISPTLSVEVDDNEQGQTTGILNRCLPNRSRKIQTDSGDLFFDRED